jgi:hypothetical protein
MTCRVTRTERTRYPHAPWWRVGTQRPQLGRRRDCRHEDARSEMSLSRATKWPTRPHRGRFQKDRVNPAACVTKLDQFLFNKAQALQRRG